MICTNPAMSTPPIPSVLEGRSSGVAGKTPGSQRTGTPEGSAATPEVQMRAQARASGDICQECATEPDRRTMGAPGAGPALVRVTVR
jgi:hypothetical protein